MDEQQNERNDILNQIENFEFERLLGLTGLKVILGDDVSYPGKEKFIDKCVTKVDFCNSQLSYLRLKLNNLDTKTMTERVRVEKNVH